MLEKNHFWFLVVILFGAAVGGMVGENLASSPLPPGVTHFLVQKFTVVQVPPVDIDLFILKLSFGFSFSPNLLTALGMVLGAVLYHKF